MPLSVVTDSATGERVKIDRPTARKMFQDEDRMSATRGDRFTRKCNGCDIDNPAQLFISTVCNHMFCPDCVHLARQACGRVACYQCDRTTTFVRIFDDGHRSRECGICFETPFCRVILNECGHLMCRVCMLEIHKKRAIVCPFCRKESKLMSILCEEVIQTEEVAGPRRSAREKRKPKYLIVDNSKYSYREE